MRLEPIFQSMTNTSETWFLLEYVSPDMKMPVFLSIKTLKQITSSFIKSAKPAYDICYLKINSHCIVRRGDTNLTGERPMRMRGGWSRQTSLSRAIGPYNEYLNTYLF